MFLPFLVCVTHFNTESYSMSPCGSTLSFLLARSTRFYISRQHYYSHWVPNKHLLNKYLLGSNIEQMGGLPL